MIGGTSGMFSIGGANGMGDAFPAAAVSFTLHGVSGLAGGGGLATEGFTAFAAVSFGTGMRFAGTGLPGDAGTKCFGPALVERLENLPAYVSSRP